MGPCLGRRQSRRVDSLAHITSREPRRVTGGHRLLCAVTAAVTCGHEACPSGPGTGAAHAPAPSVLPAAPAQRAGDQLTSDVRAHAHGRWALLPPWAGPGGRAGRPGRCGALAPGAGAGRWRLLLGTRSRRYSVLHTDWSLTQSQQLWLETKLPMEDSKPPQTAQHVLQMGRLGTGAIDAILARNNADQTRSTPKGRSHTRFHRLYKVSCAERQHGHWHGPGIEAGLRSRCTHWPGPAQTWPPTQGRPAARTRTRRGHRPLAGSSRSDGLGACTEAAARPALGCSGLSGPRRTRLDVPATWAETEGAGAHAEDTAASAAPWPRRDAEFCFCRKLHEHCSQSPANDAASLALLLGHHKAFRGLPV